MSKKGKPTGKSSSAKSSFIDSLIKYTFATLLIFVPLYPKFPLFSIPNTYVAVRAEDFILALLAGLLITRLPYFIKIVNSHPTSKSILLYLSIGLLSVFSAVFVTRTAEVHIGLLHWARRVEYVVPFFAALYLTKDKTNLTFFLKLLPFVALGVFAYGIAQIYFQAPVIITQNSEYSKGLVLTLQPGVNLASTFAGHYDLATYLVMSLSLFLSLILFLKQKWLKLLGFVFLILLFWLQLRTGSRIAFGSLLIVLPLVLVLNRKPALILPLFILAAIGLANTPSIAGRFATFANIFRFQYIQEQVKGVFDSRTSLNLSVWAAEEPLPEIEATITPESLRPIQQDRSTSIRLDVEWPRALRALAKNPFLGTGYSSIDLSTDNDYLRALGETGLLGFLAWLSIIINLIAELIRGLKLKLKSYYRHYLIGLMGAVLGFLIIATFIDVFEASKVATLFWAYTGLGLGILINKKIYAQ